MVSLRGNIEEVMFCSLNSRTLLWGKISNFDIFQIGNDFFFQVLLETDIILQMFLNSIEFPTLESRPLCVSCRKKAQQDATHMDILIFKAMNRNFWEHPANSSGFMEMWFPIISNIVIVFSINIFALKQKLKETAFSNEIFMKEVSILKRWRAETSATRRAFRYWQRHLTASSNCGSTVSSLERILSWILVPKAEDKGTGLRFYFLHVCRGVTQTCFLFIT